MLDVRYGDRGPRVVLLQVLLNRRGARLKVDGVFGPLTRVAVGGARQRLVGTPGPRADSPFWLALLAEQRLGCVDAFDLGEERFLYGAAIAGAHGSKVVTTGAMCNGVQSVVQGILQQAKAAGPLALLRTWGHGNRGRWMSFTVGDIVHTTQANPVLGAAVAAERYSYIDADNFDEMSRFLLPIKRCFAGVGIYEHHACSLGKVEATRRMMGRLANLLGVPVEVGVGKQLIPNSEETALRFQNPTFVAYPGSQKSWIDKVLAGERSSM